MVAAFSLVYPTRHRPEFIAQALRILEAQGHDGFEVVVSDSFTDPKLSCEAICREGRLPNVRLRPDSRLVHPRPATPTPTR